MDLHLEVKLGGSAEELMQEVVGSTLLSRLTTTTDPLASGLTAALGTIPTEHLSVPILLESLDTCLGGCILDCQVRHINNSFTHHNLKKALDQLDPHLASPLSPRAVGWTNLLLEDGGFVILEELLTDVFPHEITA